MRIVIDLQCCQSRAASDKLQLACAMAAQAGAHECVVALSDRYPASIEPIRAALAATPAQVRVCALPAGAGPDVCQLIYASFIATLGAAALLVPAGEPAPAAGQAYAVVLGEHGDNADAAWRKLLRAAQAHSAPANALPRRPRLAYVSPLPPVRSGFADYSADLIPELARFYDIDLVAAQDKVDDARLAPYPVRTVAWFEDNAHRFDRILYHVGNSQAHQHMFALLRRHPGIVVLHDFFLSGVLDNLEREGSEPHAFLAALYESHGYAALAEHARDGRNAAIWKYPVNKGVLDHAVGAIVHSEFPCELARAWYGADAAHGWRQVPLLRAQPAPAVNRAAARARLKLGPGDYLVCSLGMLGRIKLNDELLDAFLASPLAADPRCKLVFVGQNEAGLYGVALAAKVRASAAASRIRITGFVTPAQYRDYLAACDTAVQLRASTRGETSASVLDCLLHGVPTIINAHGSNAALDPALLLKLPDAFSITQLADALASLFSDPQRRAALGQRASAFMLAEHAPARAGQLYVDAIEQFARQAPLCHYQRLITELARSEAPLELADAARVIAFNQGPVSPRQLLIDVSAIATTDLRTGIQRVVRSVLLALVADPPPGWRIEPVFSTGANRPYHYARSFMLGLMGVPGPALEDAPADLHPGDCFLGLDLFTNGTAQNESLLGSMRDLGVNIVFVVFDLLPVLREDFFPFGTAQHFRDFLGTVSRVSAGLLCISRSVADEAAAWVAAEKIARAAPLRLAYFHLGADIAASVPSFGLPDGAAKVLAAIAVRPSFLMVGTVEPRKGHAQALAAFEQLWRDGADVNLIVVGKQGWLVDKLAASLHGHAEKERRLFWLPGVSDEMLLALYARCAALLAASEGEGFGLPLIEAAQHGAPIIARDIAVFREVAGEHAYYFSGLEAGALAAAVDDWLGLYREGKAPPSGAMPWLTWKQSARQVIDAVEGRRWYREVAGPQG